VAVNRGSPLAGRTAGELARDFHLALLARGRTAEDWETATGDLRIGEGDHLMVGGPMIEVLRLAVRDHTIFGRPRRIVRPSGLHRQMRRPAATLLPDQAAILGGMLVVTAVVFGVTLGLDPVHAVYHPDHGVRGVHP
jgi:hypothetical protein